MAASCETIPTARVVTQLARMFYNSELVNRANSDRLEQLVARRLSRFDHSGKFCADPDELVPGGTFADMFRAKCGEIKDADLKFHIEGDDSESYISHFSRTKWKKYESSAEFLKFCAAQIHLLFANLTPKDRDVNFDKIDIFWVESYQVD